MHTPHDITLSSLVSVGWLQVPSPGTPEPLDHGKVVRVAHVLPRLPLSFILPPMITNRLLSVKKPYDSSTGTSTAWYLYS